MQEPVEAPKELPVGETGGGGGGGGGGGRGKEAGKEPQKLILHPIPINLDPNATAQPKDNSLPVHILPTPTPHATPETPTAKAISSTLRALQNLKKLVAFVQTLTLHRRHWQLLTLRGIADGSGAGLDMEHLDLGISISSTSSNSPKGLRNWFGGA